MNRAVWGVRISWLFTVYDNVVTSTLTFSKHWVFSSSSSLNNCSEHIHAVVQSSCGSSTMHKIIHIQVWSFKLALMLPSNLSMISMTLTMACLFTAMWAGVSISETSWSLGIFIHGQSLEIKRSIAKKNMKWEYCRQKCLVEERGPRTISRLGLGCWMVTVQYK